MITYGKQFIDNLDKKAVLDTLSSQWLTQGQKLRSSKKNLVKDLALNIVCVVSNGTTGLYLTGIALGWTKGDIVLCSAVSFIAGANSIVYSGATPDFIDINEFSYNIDVIKLENKIKKYLKKKLKIKAIIVTDYAGNPSDWENLKKFQPNTK